MLMPGDLGAIWEFPKECLPNRVSPFISLSHFEEAELRFKTKFSGISIFSLSVDQEGVTITYLGF